MPPARLPRVRAFLPTKSLAALLTALIAIAVITGMTYDSLERRAQNAAAIARVTEVRNALNQVNVLLEQAQSGQRGFLLTVDESYARWPDAAAAAIPGHLDQLRVLLAGDAQRLRRVESLASLVAARLAVIDETLALQRSGKGDLAKAMVISGRGRTLMEEARAVIDRLQTAVAEDLTRSTSSWDAAVRWSSYVTFGGAGVMAMMLFLVGALASRDYRTLENESWVRRVQLTVGSEVQGDHRVDSVAAKVLQILVPNVGADVAAIHAVRGDRLERVAGHALAPDAPHEVRLGEGLTGQAAVSGEVVHLTELPAAYLTVSSATGRARPRQVVIVPARSDGEVRAVIELGFLRPVGDAEVSAVTRVSELVAVALRAAADRTRLEQLLEETQRQAEELQAQEEELRVSNEELEQQSGALQLSQAQLENQQSELEEVNAQLEEQTASLERQRDDLARTGGELQRANEYKSQFLANMSHELRTPLNSSLILAKLLADNREGNLTEEQVHFASTIYAAGNDLLTLINDILDLSKIEAGMLDVRPEPVPVTRMLDELRDTFAPVAGQKQLALELEVGAGVPDAFDTDPTRVRQILRNLLSNALKFTERGGVTLAVSRDGEQLCFAVRDTGIGVPEDQLEAIFQPFRQADGAINRKFGGTGLGLSISRDLARMLGGDLRARSEAGRGSTFTLSLPVTASAAAVTRPRAVSVPPPVLAPAPAPRTTTVNVPAVRAETRPQVLPQPFPDDRARIDRASRSILIVEDDEAFARVLFDLAHEREFQAVVATSGDDGLALARELQPSAIVLDIALPDRSGLAVLDALKRDSRTRHIPVHIISAHDYARTALEMGAAGYALKPVEREKLVEALERLEERFTRKLRRVLVVEDDPLLRESTARLLQGEHVETVTAGTTAEALALLRASTFDCMVLDFSLPDGSGLELLEDMSRQGDSSFPPVIVYTGRNLSDEQLRQLERFSHSIIIKGAKSPERLLDEVTLFLHQVESDLPPERQRMLRDARNREAVFEGRRILVVEDDVRNVFALTAVLEPKGARVAVARNGREALAQLDADGDVDLVLMDLMMPEMDGLEAMRHLRKDPRFTRLPIIALTAKAMADDRERSLDAGANDYIAKPLDVDKLLSLARVWIRK